MGLNFFFKENFLKLCQISLHIPYIFLLQYTFSLAPLKAS